MCAHAFSSHHFLHVKGFSKRVIPGLSRFFFLIVLQGFEVEHASKKTDMRILISYLHGESLYSLRWLILLSFTPLGLCMVLARKIQQLANVKIAFAPAHGQGRKDTTIEVQASDQKVLSHNSYRSPLSPTFTRLALRVSLLCLGPLLRPRTWALFRESDPVPVGEVKLQP